MTDELGAALREAWRNAFSDTALPAVILDRERKAVEANGPGREWLERQGGADGLLSHLEAKLPLERGQVLSVPPPSAPEGLVLLGLKGERLLLCPAAEGACAYEYVRLFSGHLRAVETADRRAGRLDVYHELLTHDVPNYITAVYGYLQMMQSSELPPEKVHRYAEAALRQAEALNHLVDTARELRSLETSALRDLAPLDLGEALLRSAEEAREANRDKEAAIDLRAPPGRHCVMAEAALPQAFTVVLDNAIRYSDGPEVVVELVEDGRWWHLTFTDRGRGIPDDKKRFVFLRFDRLDKEKKIRGSGLGLALARALLERHGGRIWVANRVPGDHTRGSVFHILLPKCGDR